MSKSLITYLLAMVSNLFAALVIISAMNAQRMDDLGGAMEILQEQSRGKYYVILVVLENGAPNKDALGPFDTYEEAELRLREETCYGGIDSVYITQNPREVYEECGRE